MPRKENAMAKKDQKPAKPNEGTKGIAGGKPAPGTPGVVSPKDQASGTPTPKRPESKGGELF
jgi:hypothetical protein